MTSELRDELVRARDAVTVGAAPTDLWQRGQSYRRRRALATVGAPIVVAVVALTLGLNSLIAAAPTHADDPARIPQTSGALPDRLDDVGRLGRAAVSEKAAHATWKVGQLAAVLQPVTGSNDQLVGVSADTGEYVILPSPAAGWSPASTPGENYALKADGRRLVMSTTETVVVADLVSGKVQKLPYPSSPIQPWTTRWVDSGQVIKIDGGYQEGSVSVLVDPQTSAVSTVVNTVESGSRAFNFNALDALTDSIEAPQDGDNHLQARAPGFAGVSVTVPAGGPLSLDTLDGPRSVTIDSSRIPSESPYVTRVRWLDEERLLVYVAYAKNYPNTEEALVLVTTSGEQQFLLQSRVPTRLVDLATDLIGFDRPSVPAPDEPRLR